MFENMMKTENLCKAKGFVDKAKLDVALGAAVLAVAGCVLDILLTDKCKKKQQARRH